ncbi:MAG: hypothetical protein K8R88_06950 [Armatimonadetes bacterium]|nr:hypothetical protein [Armatimonadota bacterium]
MGKTLLIGAAQNSWREYIKTYRGDRDLLVLDPADAHFGNPARVALLRGDKVVDWRFVGSLDPTKNPLAVVGGTVALLRQAAADALILLFPFRETPVHRQLALTLAEIIDPAEILIPNGSPCAGEAWPIGPENVVLETEYPDLVLTAQRRARWIEVLEKCQDHEVPLDEVHFMNMRFGGGKRLPADYLERGGIQNVLWAETAAKTLLLVARKALDDEDVGRAMNIAHASKVISIDPLSFSGLICSFARQNGEEMGIGMIEECDFHRGVMRVRCTAVPPAPVRIIKVGMLRIDSSGRELHELKPWSL